MQLIVEPNVVPKGKEAHVKRPGERHMRLTDDLIAILTSFSGRLYGMRNHKQKKIAAPIEEELHTS
jgi:predicted site-specific integrase-resolvase